MKAKTTPWSVIMASRVAGVDHYSDETTQAVAKIEAWALTAGEQLEQILQEEIPVRP